MPFPNKDTQWKPGKSGNPKGKPKGVEHSSTRLRRLLDVTESLENPITGTVEGFTVLEQIDMKLILQAKKGNLHAIKELLDRLEGKPGQVIENTGEQKLIVETRKHRGNKSN